MYLNDYKRQKDLENWWTTWCVLVKAEFIQRFSTDTALSTFSTDASCSCIFRSLGYATKVMSVIVGKKERKLPKKTP